MLDTYLTKQGSKELGQKLKKKHPELFHIKIKKELK